MEWPDAGALEGKRRRVNSSDVTDDDLAVLDDNDESSDRPPLQVVPEGELSALAARKTDFDATTRQRVGEIQLALKLEERGKTAIFRAADCEMGAGSNGGRCARCRARSSTLKRALEQAVAMREKGTPSKKAPRSVVLDSPGLATQVVARAARENESLKRRLLAATAQRRSEGVVDVQEPQSVNAPSMSSSHLSE